MKSTAARIICRLLIALTIWTPLQVAQAGMIGTDAVVSSVSQADRAALVQLLTRSDVAAQLRSLGIDAATARDRVAALTDQEVQSLTGRINSLPAGADAAGLLLLVIVVAAVWWLWRR
ncbi:MAG: PA2779 family protein [Betaproteobacteria bacterium]